MNARHSLGTWPLDWWPAMKAVARIFLLTSFLAIWGVLPASAQVFAFQASNQNTAGIGNRGVMGVTGTGPNGSLNTAANQPAGLQLDGLPTMHTLDVGVGDFNGDGVEDIAAISADDTMGTGLPNTITLTITYSDGDGTLGPPQVFTLRDTMGTPFFFAVPHSMAIADINLDGISDIAIAVCVTEITGLSFSRVLLVNGADLRNAPPGSLVSADNFSTDVALPGITGTPAAVAIGRLQNGPIPGIAVAVAGTPGLVLVILPDQMTGSFTGPGVKIELFRTTGAINDPLLTGIHTTRAIRIAKGNFSTPVVTNPPDGDLDIMVATSIGIEVVENNAIQMPATFTGTKVLLAGNEPVGVAIADFNNDNIPDVVALSRGSGTVTTFLAQAPAGSGYQPGIDSFVGANPVSLTPMDFNNDGNEDIVVAEQSSGPGVPGQVIVFTGNGLGIFVFRATIFLIGNEVPGSVAVSRRLDLKSRTDDIVVADLGTPPGSIPSDPGGVLFFDASNGYNTVGIPTGAATTTQLISSQNPQIFGVPVTFGANVKDPAGNPLPNIKVSFNNNGFPIGLVFTDMAGNASFTTSSLAVGTNLITALALGNNLTVNSSLSAVVNQVVIGGCQSLPPVTVTPPPAGVPNGTVFAMYGSLPGPTAGFGAGGGNGPPYSFSVSGNLPLGMGISLSSNNTLASLVGNPGVTGTFKFTLTATDSMGCFGSANSAITIDPEPASTTATSSANPSVSGQGVTFTATEAETGGGTVTPTGAVQLVVNGTNFGTPVPLVNGVGTFPPITTLATGTDMVQFLYSGDANNNPSFGTLTQTVNKGSTSITLMSSANPSGLSVPVTFTVMAAPVAPAAGMPMGTVNFFDGATQIGTGTLMPGSPCQAMFTTSSLTLGTHSITAVYGGDANFNGSTSGALSQVVVIGTPGISISKASQSTPSPGVLAVTFKISNTGTGLARNISINSLAFKTLSGTGAVSLNTTLSPMLPVTIASLNPGASTTVQLFFNVPSTVTRFSITENGTLQDVTGTNFAYSVAQAIIP